MGKDYKYRTGISRDGQGQPMRMATGGPGYDREAVGVGCNRAEPGSQGATPGMGGGVGESMDDEKRNQIH